MAKKNYYWLRLKKDFFKRHDIQIIESMPNGKDYILFYLKLLVESVDHEGNLRFNDTIPYNENMLATITNTNVDIVRSAMKVFTDLKMIEVLGDETIYMSEVIKMVGAETYWAEQKRKQRQKEPLKIGQCPPNVQAVSNVSNQEIDIEKEIDIETDKEDTTKVVSSNKLLPIIESWNSLGLQKLISINPSTNRYKMLNVRIRDYGIEKVIEAIKSISKSDFLMGRAKDFVITFDWFVKPNNFTKVLEGNYMDKPKATKVDQKTKGFVNFDGRPYTETEYDDLERKLLGWDKED